MQLGYDGLFVVKRVGWSGGLMLLWKGTNSISLIRFSYNFIDAEIEAPELGKWRSIGFYGYLETSQHRESWDLLRLLSTSSSLPWVCIGDFSDLLAANEKRGNMAQPKWKLVGFQSAIADCNLVDLSMDGYQYTWERARGTDKWVEERLDKAFASEEWFRRFNRAKVFSLKSSCSNHLPILLDFNPIQPVPRHRRFLFENTWLHEVDCGEVIQHSWLSSAGNSIQNKIMACGSALVEWGGHLARDFHEKLQECKNRMANVG